MNKPYMYKLFALSAILLTLLLVFTACADNPDKKSDITDAIGNSQTTREAFADGSTAVTAESDETMFLSETTFLSETMFPEETTFLSETTFPEETTLSEETTLPDEGATESLEEDTMAIQTGYIVLEAEKYTISGYAGGKKCDFTLRVAIVSPSADNQKNTENAMYIDVLDKNGRLLDKCMCQGLGFVAASDSAVEVYSLYVGTDASLFSQYRLLSVSDSDEIGKTYDTVKFRGAGASLSIGKYSQAVLNIPSQAAKLGNPWIDYAKKVAYRLDKVNNRTVLVINTEEGYTFGGNIDRDYINKIGNSTVDDMIDMYNRIK